MASPQIDATVQDLGKSVLTSKTLWAAIVLPLVTALVPPAAPWIAANPQTASLIVGVLMAGLRLVTNKPLSLPGSSSSTPG